MRGDCFARNGSPLGGRTVPRDWSRMDWMGKRATLVRLGWAPDVYEAGRMLARHAAAARRGRKEAQEERRRAAARAWWLRD